ncbi:MAG: NUDIX domain-containing protein [Erysipelotrichaceae bacterium]|nr:NUDIX domain-containing protein [Erysipelotrichaceae bacterium]
MDIIEKYGYRYHLFDEGRAYHIIDGLGMNMYLLKGKERSLLIDTGAKVGELRKLVEELAEGEYDVINTHGHYDHVAGDWQFDRVFISKEDEPVLKDYFASIGRGIDFDLVHFDETTPFDLGDRTITPVRLSGHTAGSYGFIDPVGRILYSGDAVMRNVSLQHNGRTSIEDYRHTLVRLWDEFSERFDWIIAGHGHRQFGFRPLEKEYILKMIDCIDKIDPEQCVMIPNKDPGEVWRFVADGKKFEDYDSLCIEFRKNEFKPGTHIMPTHIIASAGVVLNDNDEILLVKSNHYGWMFPGGQVEVGENAIDAIKREVMEETGIEIAVEELFCVSSNTGTHPGYGGVRVVPTKIALDFICRAKGGTLRASDENSESSFVSREKALEMIQTPAIAERFRAYLEYSGRPAYLEYVTHPEFELKLKTHI